MVGVGWGMVVLCETLVLEVVFDGENDVADGITDALELEGLMLSTKDRCTVQ